MTKFTLLKTANQTAITRLSEETTIRENFTTLAGQHNTDSNLLAESVIDVLANIAAAASTGKEFKAMNIDSTAAFLAGVEKMSQVLPKLQDPGKGNMLRALTAAGIGKDGFVSTAVAPIAQFGAKDDQLRQKYADLLKSYIASIPSGHPAGDTVVTAVRRLQVSISMAMKSAPAQQATPSVMPMRQGMA
jgi:hypothetical protein